MKNQIMTATERCHFLLSLSIATATWKGHQQNLETAQAGGEPGSPSSAVQLYYSVCYDSLLTIISFVDCGLLSSHMSQRLPRVCILDYLNLCRRAMCRMDIKVWSFCPEGISSIAFLLHEDPAPLSTTWELQVESSVSLVSFPGPMLFLHTLNRSVISGTLPYFIEISYFIWIPIYCEKQVASSQASKNGISNCVPYQKYVYLEGNK